MEKIIKVGCDIFVLKEGTLLLGVRKNTYGEGDWGLPGGHVEYGETIIECAKRELKEETGIEGEKLELITVSDEPRSDAHYIHLCFVINDFKGEAKLMEPEKCEKWQFFDLNKLPENIFWPHIPLIKNLKNKILYKF